MADVHELLRATAGRAAAPFERRSCPGLRPVGPGASAHDRLERWRAAASGGDERRFAALLAVRGIDDPAAWLADAEVADVERLPAWAGAWRWLLEPCADPARIGEAAAWLRERAVELREGTAEPATGSLVAATAAPAPAAPPAAAAFAPFAVAAASVVRAADGARVLGTAAVELLAADLARRLGRVAARVLAGAGRVEPHEAEGLWWATLEHRPALVRAMGAVAVHWRAATEELIRRLVADLPALRERFAGGAPVRVARCLAGAGDPHAGGRTVTLVELDDGTRVVYKPRDLRLGRAAVRALDVPVALPDALLRDGYGWETHLGPRPPGSPTEEEALARRCGAALRLLSLLGAQDLTASNVAALGDRLAILDAETLLGARPEHGGPPDADGDADLVRQAGLLSARAGAGDGVEVGGLAAPTLAGIADRAGALAAGFAVAQRHVAARAEAIGAALDALDGPPARVLLRTSSVYGRLRAESLTAEALADGVERELVLERLWRVRDRRDVAPPLVRAEIDALRDGDIPVFRAHAGARDLLAPSSGDPVGTLAEPPLERVRARLARLPATPEPATLAAVEAGRACAAASAAVRRLAPLAAAMPERRGPAPDPGELAARRRAWQEAAAPGDPERFDRLLAARGLDPAAAHRRLSGAAERPTGATPATAEERRTVATEPPATAPAPVPTVAPAAWAGAVEAFLRHGVLAGPPAQAGVEAFLVRLAGEAGRRAIRGRRTEDVLRAGAPWERFGRERVRRRQAGWAAVLEPEAVAGAACALAADVLECARPVLDDALARDPGAAEPLASGDWRPLLDAAPALVRLLGVVAVRWEEALDELVVRAARDAPALAVAFGGPPEPRIARLELRRAGRQRGGRTAALVGLAGGPPVFYKPRDLRLNDALDALLRRVSARLDLGLRLPARVARPGYGWEEAIDARPPAGDGEARALAYRLGALARVLSTLGAVDMTSLNVLPVGDDLVVVDPETALAAEVALAPPAPEPPRLPLVDLRLLSDPSGAARPGELPRDLGFLAAAGLERVAAHPERIVAGFADAHRALAAEREAVAGPGGALDAFAGAELRVLLRSSRVYATLARQARGPAALRDGLARDAVLERLWRAWAPAVPAGLIEEEVAALRDGDQPLFTADPATAAVRGRPGGRAFPILREPPLDRARRAVRALPDDPPAAELDQLRALVFAAAPEARTASDPTPGARPAAEAAPADWLALARAESRRLVAHVDADPDGPIGLEASPWSGMIRLERLGPDHLNGRAGLAAVLHDAAWVEPAAGPCARRLLGGLADDLHRATARLTDPPGAYWGLGAMIAALAHEPAHHEAIAAAADRLRGPFPDHWTLDLGGGIAGLAVALAAARTAGAAVPGDLLERLADTLVAAWEPGPGPPAPGLTRRAGAPLVPFPPVGLSAALALARLHAAGVPLPPGVDPAVTGRAVLADPGAGPVARLLARELAGPDREPEPACAGGDPVGPELTLLAIEADLLAGDLACARARFIPLLHARRAAGRWFPDAPAPDRHRLSALWGHAAVVSVLLRLAGPTAAAGSPWLLSSRP